MPLVGAPSLCYSVLSRETEPMDYMITKEFIRLAYIGIRLYAGDIENTAAARMKKLKAAEWTNDIAPA